MILFQGKHFHGLLTDRLQTVAATISRLTLSQLRDPALAGSIEKLWAQQRPDIPVIFPEQKCGRKRQEREGRNDHGRPIIVEVTYLDVYVPYTGDSSMFKVMPSSSQLLNERIHIEPKNLKYSLPLDDANDDKINRVFAQVENNLKALRTDLDNFGRSAINTLSGLAADRKDKLEADAQKASKLSFPVD